MNILNYFDEMIDKLKILTWSKSDKENLFRIIIEIYNSDGTYTDDEKKDFRRRTLGIGINEAELMLVDFENAINELKTDVHKMEIAYFWIASSLFSDEDYDKIEQKFIDQIIIKYMLDEIKFRTIIKTIRDKKIDNAISELFKDI